MPPSTKESDTLTATPASSTESAAKQQTVAVEVPVTVNGARTIEGSDKREPFSETTKTVLVHGSGAVIRLTSSVAPGQLLFLTNERTKKEVVSQVVKSKNYRNVTGYVELEFTEPAVGFWGMRFPSDKAASASQRASTAIRPPAANGTPTPAGQIPVASKPGTKTEEKKSVVPVAPISSAGSSIVPPALDSGSLLGDSKAKPVETRVPAAPVPTSPASQVAAKPTVPQSAEPSFPTFDVPRTSEKAASLFEPAAGSPTAGSVDLSSLAPFFDVKPAGAAVVPPPSPPAPAASEPETEELKQHAARLQEQLSSLNFVEPTSGPTENSSLGAPSFPIVEKDKEPVHEKAAEILESPEASLSAPILADLPEVDVPVKVPPAVPSATLESLEQEELKIPAWLEPLARNASAPSSTQELVLREKAKRPAEQPEVQELSAEPRAAAKEKRVSPVRMPEFGSALPIDEEQNLHQTTAKKPERGVLYGAIAAGILVVAAGGWWYMSQRDTGVHASVPFTPVPAASAPAATLPTKPQTEAAAQENLTAQAKPAVLQTAPPAKTDLIGKNTSAASHSGPAPASSTAARARGAQAAANSSNNAAEVTKPSSDQPEATPAEVKKPNLGEIHLATPKVSQNKRAASGAEADPGLLEEDQPETDADTLNSGLAVGNKQPARPTAPVPVGGEVRQAKLISEVPPVYPQLAKAQHVSGNVTIDALIDANGRVTTMKLISGPSLLHQAAMDALKQWKYQPATLDGKAVPMHLTVTIQFRLQ